MPIHEPELARLYTLLELIVAPTNFEVATETNHTGLAMIDERNGLFLQYSSLASMHERPILRRHFHRLIRPGKVSRVDCGCGIVPLFVASIPAAYTQSNPQSQTLPERLHTHSRVHNAL